MHHVNNDKQRRHTVSCFFAFSNCRWERVCASLLKNSKIEQDRDEREGEIEREREREREREWKNVCMCVNVSPSLSESVTVCVSLSCTYEWCLCRIHTHTHTHTHSGTGHNNLLSNNRQVSEKHSKWGPYKDTHAHANTNCWQDSHRECVCVCVCVWQWGRTDWQIDTLIHRQTISILIPRISTSMYTQTVFPIVKGLPHTTYTHTHTMVCWHTHKHMGMPIWLHPSHRLIPK